MKVKEYGKGYQARRKEEKRAEAEDRCDKWHALSPAKQLAELDRRLGKDVGAKKQRARIQEKLQAKGGNK